MKPQKETRFQAKEELLVTRCRRPARARAERRDSLPDVGEPAILSTAVSELFTR